MRLTTLAKVQDGIGEGVFAMFVADAHFAVFFVWVSAIIKETVRVDNCQWNSFTVWAKYVSLVPPFINRMVEIVLVAYLHDCDRFVCDVEKSLCVLWHRLTTPL